MRRTPSIAVFALRICTYPHACFWRRLREDPLAGTGYVLSLLSFVFTGEFRHTHIDLGGDATRAAGGQREFSFASFIPRVSSRFSLLTAYSSDM